MGATCASLSAHNTANAHSPLKTPRSALITKYDARVRSIDTSTESQRRTSTPRLDPSPPINSFHTATSPLVNDITDWVWETSPMEQLKMLMEGSLTLNGRLRGRSPVAYQRRKHMMHRSTDRETRSRSESRERPHNRSRSRSRSASRDRPIELAAYPPYIPIRGLFPQQTHGLQSRDVEPKTRAEMIRGSTCQHIMSLMTQYESIQTVVKQLRRASNSDDVNKTFFGVKEIEVIVSRSREHGLTAWTPLQYEKENWNGVRINDAFFAHELKEYWRADPIDATFTGSHEVTEGWWNEVGPEIFIKAVTILNNMQIESSENRHWAVWRIPNIGPPEPTETLEMDEDF